MEYLYLYGFIFEFLLEKKVIVAYIFIAKSIYMNQKKQILKGSVGLTTFIVLFMFILFYLGVRKMIPYPKMII